MNSVHWLSRQAWTPHMSEYLVGENLPALARAVAGDRHYIRTGELATRIHRLIWEQYGASSYRPQWLISELSRQGVRPKRYHGRPPVYDVRDFRGRTP
jgi:hypothetical protein